MPLQSDIREADDRDSIDALLANSPHIVTVFTLSWCGYCHAVKNLLQSLNIGFHDIELDTGEFAATDRHTPLRQQLQAMTGSRTLPQVFVGRHPMGGFTETTAASRSGELQQRIANQGQLSEPSAGEEPSADEEPSAGRAPSADSPNPEPYK